jgi:hypothetical protein
MRHQANGDLLLKKTKNKEEKTTYVLRSLGEGGYKTRKKKP